MKVLGMETDGRTGGSMTVARFAPGACLTVIIPVYNERATIETILERVLKQPCVAEVIVVDDGSTDDSFERMIRCADSDERVKVIRHDRNLGKGAALRSGFEHAGAPVIIVQDADLEYDPADYEALVRPIREGRADVVYGSRFSGRERFVARTWHTLGNRILTLISNLASNLWLTDEATGYKVFRADILPRLDLKENGFGFCPEFTAKVSKLRLRVYEVPVHYRGRSRAEGKKIRLRDGLAALWCILRYNFL